MVTYDQFITKSLIASYISGREPLNDFVGYKNKDEFVLFKFDVLDEYLEVSKFLGNVVIKLRNLTESQYQEFLKRNIKHTKTSLHSPIYIFTKDFFKLDGHKYKKLRQSMSNFKNGIPDLENKDIFYPIEIKTKPNNQQDVIDLIHLWKEQRKDAHFQFFIGYEKNYYKNFFNLGKNIGLYFYANDVLIGYNVLEQVDDNKFNLLYGKTDMNYKRFFNYMDVSTYKYLLDNFVNGDEFFVNSGDTGGDQSMLDFKTKHFDVLDICPIYNVTIDNTKKINKIF